ncbi:hypothetical protein LTR96_004313 [Exophiala xenobiotica]|nr:hypothetical protein LTR92_004230 [Exophiala xenobiotica]KAK5271035.1 hypothetical protein LTR96_004313 [Exophiala xenobiotica]KAK5339926.1 hypothetical protein LTR98_004728 [Exophiala xenobiotica]KAK5364362.1 hypothetical protein LTS13_008976 [Exophiala xenobiotica]KAK5399073.1 hypothetical protein LTR79_004071 [Exophiala xenobiotica]
MKRKISTLESDRQLFDDLLTAIRVATPTQLDPLLKVIRNGGSRHSIRDYLEFEFRGSPDAMQLDGTTNHVSRPIRRPMLGRIQDVVNPPKSVPAKPWTTVTDDDDFVSHLVSLWFTWAHPWWHWVDEKLFLSAMRSGDKSSLVCTPYLVNMILADACLLDTLTDDGCEPNEWIREQFYQEAKKGLEAEEGRVSLALVAALGVQWTYLNTNGQDSLGNTVLCQQIFLSKDLKKWRQKIQRSSNLAPAYLDSMNKSLDRLEWTLYCLKSCTLLDFEKTQFMHLPSCPKPEAHHETEDYIGWTPYPQPHPPVDFHPDCHFLSFVSLIEKSARAEALMSKQEKQTPKETLEELAELYTGVRNWDKTIPECMLLDGRSSPHIIALHALHNWVVVMMSKQLAAVESGNRLHPSLIRTQLSGQRPEWRETAISGSIQIADLFEQIRLEWGTDHFPVIIMQPVAIAIFPLLEGLSERPRSQEAFFKLCLTIRAASRRFSVGKGLLLAVQQAAQERNIELPENCRDFFADLPSGNGSKDKSDLADKGLDYLLDKWEDLDLENAVASP